MYATGMERAIDDECFAAGAALGVFLFDLFSYFFLVFVL